MTDWVLEPTLGGRAADFWWRADEIGNLAIRRTARTGQSHAAKGRMVSREELEALVAWMAERQWVRLECLPARLRDGTAKEGMGRFLVEQLGWPAFEATFASHIAAVLTAAEILTWNGKRRGMAFRLASDDLGRLRALYERRRAEAPTRQPERPAPPKRSKPGGQTPPQFRLGPHFRALSRKLRAEIDSVSGGQHPAEIGDRREAVVRGFLRGVLPEDLRIVSGEIFASSGDSSRQVDALVYHRKSPTLQRAERSVIVAAESVLAAIEIKPLLRRAELADALGNLHRAKALRPTAVFAPRLADPRQPAVEPNPPAFTALFAIDSVAPRRVLQVIKELEADTTASLAIDAVCLLDRGILFRYPGLLEPPALARPDPGAPAAPMACFETADSLVLFTVLLLEQLALRVPHLPDLRAYLGDLDLPEPTIL